MITVDAVAEIYREHGLDEPWAFPWIESDRVAGLVTGFIRIKDGRKYLDVDHMIVRPSARQKFKTMMQMSEAATQAAFDGGCEFILLSIFHRDPRRSGLNAWAKRMGFELYASSDDADWYARHRPARKEVSDGQGRQATVSETAPDSA